MLDKTPFFNNNFKKITIKTRRKNKMTSLINEFISYWRNNTDKVKINREKMIFDILCSYYGIDYENKVVVEAKTLERIGIDNHLTRERIRQLLTKVVNNFNKEEKNRNFYKKLKNDFLLELKNADFIHLSSMLKKPYLAEYKNNPRGLLNFLTHSGVEHVMYRNQYYLFVSKSKKEHNETKSAVVKLIQEHNRDVRKQQTLENTQSMSKTVTYLPPYMRNFYLDYSEKHNYKLNNLYTEVLEQFDTTKPYKENKAFFGKKQEWRWPPLKKNWVQIGLYIDKILFDKLEDKALSANTSVMNYIGCALAWFALSNGVKHVKKQN